MRLLNKGRDMTYSTGVGSEVFLDSLYARICGKRTVARREAGYKGAALRCVLCRRGIKGQVS